MRAGAAPHLDWRVFVEVRREELMTVLREYHAALGEIITAHDGTVEHFADDGVMVVFNDPMPVEQHELKAVRMGLAVRVRCRHST